MTPDPAAEKGKVSPGTAAVLGSNPRLTAKFPPPPSCSDPASSFCFAQEQCPGAAVGGASALRAAGGTGYFLTRGARPLAVAVGRTAGAGSSTRRSKAATPLPLVPASPSLPQAPILFRSRNRRKSGL